MFKKLACFAWESQEVPFAYCRDGKVRPESAGAPEQNWNQTASWSLGTGSPVTRGSSKLDSGSDCDGWRVPLRLSLFTLLISQRALRVGLFPPP